MTAAEEEEVDTYKVAQVVVVAGEEERRGRIILVDTSLVWMVLLGLQYAHLLDDNYVEYTYITKY